MKRWNPFLFILVFTLLTGIGSAGEVAFDDTKIATLNYPSWFKQNFYDLSADLVEAQENGKRGVLVFFSTTGCSYCKLMLQKTFADPGLAKRLQADFDVIGLEMFDDAEINDARGEILPVKDFAVREGAQFSPTLLFLDDRGERILRLVGYYDPVRLALALDYLDERSDASAQNFKTWINARNSLGTRALSRPKSTARRELIDDSLFAAPPYQLDRSAMPAKRPLLVIFESGDCQDCLRLHREVLSDPEVRAQLSDIELVRLDAEDKDTRLIAPDGRLTNPARWYESLGFTHLPGMAWFDPRGRRVLATDALVLKGRLMNSIGFVRERAYAKGWTYQRYARSENLRRLNTTQAR